MDKKIVKEFSERNVQVDQFDLFWNTVLNISNKQTSEKVSEIISQFLSQAKQGKLQRPVQVYLTNFILRNGGK